MDPSFISLLFTLGNRVQLILFWWNIESTSKLDFKRANTPMGLNSPHFKHIYHDDTVYEGFSLLYIMVFW